MKGLTFFIFMLIPCKDIYSQSPSATEPDDFLKMFENCRYQQNEDPRSPAIKNVTYPNCTQPIEICEANMVCDSPERMGDASFQLTCATVDNQCPSNPKDCARAASPEDICNSQPSQKRPRRIDAEVKEGVE